MILDKPTASSLERAAACPASCAIPVRVRAGSDAADRGNAIHGFVEAVLAKHDTREGALARVPTEWRATCAALDWNPLIGDLEPSTVHAESAYALDHVTGAARFLGRSLGRNYPASSDDEIVGTSDIDGDRFDGVPVVGDLKTGRPVTACRNNWQMRFHAYVRHQLTGSPDVLARLLYVQENGAVYVDEHLFEPADHIDLLDDLSGVVRRIREVRLDQLQVFPGEHCTYCPAYLSCPAKTALTKSLVPELHQIDQLINEMTIEQVGAAWAKLEAIKPLVKRLDAALKDAAKTHLVTLPDGRVLKEISSGKQVVSGERALALAEKYGAPIEELAACSYRSDWTYIKAMRPKVT